MKKMVTRLATLALALVAGTASLSAQLDTDNIRYRAEAGLASSKIINFGAEGKSLLGLRVSGQVLLPFENSQWAIISGLTLTNKGEVSAFREDSGIQPHTSLGLMYLQVPVNISHRFDLNRNNRIYLEFGPYVSYALSGKRASDSLDLLAKKDKQDKSFNSWEIGLGASLHYDYKNIYLKLGGELSLTSVVNKDGYLQKHIQGGTPRYGLAYVTLGYQF